MVKVKATTSSCEDLAPARYLRSRQRNSSNHETPATVDISVSTDQQETEEKDAAAAVKLFALRGCEVRINHQDPAELYCMMKQDVSRPEEVKESINDAPDVHETSLQVTPIPATTVTDPNTESQLEESQVHADVDALKTEKDKEEGEEAASEGSQTSSDQLQTEQLQAGAVNGSCAAAVEKPKGAKRNHQCHSEEDQEASHDKPGEICANGTKESSKESTGGLPAKKKRRMGMCGLTERERSHFLQVQKRENGQNGTGRAEEQSCGNTADEADAAEVSVAVASPPAPAPAPPPPSFFPAEPITEQSEVELQSDRCGVTDRQRTEVHITATPSDEADAAAGPEVKSGEAERGVGLCSEEAGLPKPDQLAEQEEKEEEEETHSGSQQLQNCKRSVTEDETEATEEQVKPSKEESQRGLCESDVVTYTSQSEASGNQDAAEAAVPTLSNGTETREGRKDEAAEDAQSEMKCGSADLRQASQTPSVSEKTDEVSGDTQNDPGEDPAARPPAVNAQCSQTADTCGPFGSRSSDYVSDSQLNAIDLTAKEEEPDPLAHLEDGTDLICGLIRELSSLNRKVMVAYRELEVLRRGGKSSRNSSH